jgi:hypothetical protein
MLSVVIFLRAMEYYSGRMESDMRECGNKAVKVDTASTLGQVNSLFIGTLFCFFIFYTDGDVYDGEWKRDTLHGRGKHMWHDGCAFDGDWRDGKRVGQGEYR